MFIVWLWTKETISGLLRNWRGTIYILFITIISMLLFSVSDLARENANFFAHQLNQKIQIDVNLMNNVTDYTTVEQEIKQIPNVQKVSFVSKQQAYEQMDKELGKQKYILESLGENPFPARLVVSLKDASQVTSVADKINKMKIAQSVEYGQSIIKQLFTVTKTIRNGGIIAALFSALITISIIVSAISSNITQRIKEIEIKKNIGAGNFVIRVPFVLEAVVITSAAGYTVYQGTLYGYTEFINLITKYVPAAPLVGVQGIQTNLLEVLLGFSVLMGLIGSLLSTEKNLRKIK